MPARVRMIERMHFFRYLVAAGVATLVDVVTYYVLVRFVFRFEVLDVLGLSLSASLVALICSYSLGLLVNFLINRYYVFTESELRAQTQFVRFFLVAGVVFVANYYFIKLLDLFLPSLVPSDAQFYPLLLRGISAACIAFLSFTFHKIFSFEVKAPKPS